MESKEQAPSTEVVATRTRRGTRYCFPGISRRAYEHPADRAAMIGLRKVPGFDMLLRKLVGIIGERSLRHLYLASAVRVAPTQFPRVYELYRDCLSILDVEGRPELFIAQTPLVNAGAIGVDKPFIVLNSGTLDLFTEDELRFIIGHEIGHILSDHVLYKTMLRLLLNLALVRIGVPIAPLAIYGIVAALKEWDRKSELSADRAGMLCVQEPNVVYTVHMKMAGGNKPEQMDVREFVRQAEDYEKGGSLIDGVFKLLNLVWRTHPFHVLRLVELKRWVDSGAYQRVVDGEYSRRDQDEAASVYAEVKDGAESYRETYQSSKDPLVRFLQDVGTSVADAGASAWERARGLFGSAGPKKGS